MRTWLNKGYGWLRSRDLVVLLSMLIITLGLWGFIRLAGAVRGGDTREADEWLLRAMRSKGDVRNPIGPVWIEEAVRDITALGSVTVLLMAVGAVSGFLIMRRQYHAFGLLLAALIGAGILNVLLKDWFDRPRPDLVPHLLRVGHASFPSGHAMLSAVVYLTLGTLLARLLEERRLKIYVLAIALGLSGLVGISRVYLGVHYPTDVLAGWTVGLIWAVICWLVARALQRGGKVEKAE